VKKRFEIILNPEGNGVDISVGVSVLKGNSVEGAVKDITGGEKCRLRIRKVLIVGLFCNGCSEKAFLKEYP
jgi:hypothetical protein